MKELKLESKEFTRILQNLTLHPNPQKRCWSWLTQA